MTTLSEEQDTRFSLVTERSIKKERDDKHMTHKVTASKPEGKTHRPFCI